MQRGSYFHTWLAGRPNTHPVHPMKHMGMIEDLERNHVTMLAWSMMGENLRPALLRYVGD